MLVHVDGVACTYFVDADGCIRFILAISDDFLVCDRLEVSCDDGGSGACHNVLQVEFVFSYIHEIGLSPDFPALELIASRSDCRDDSWCEHGALELACRNCHVVEFQDCLVEVA